MQGKSWWPWTAAVIGLIGLLALMVITLVPLHGGLENLPIAANIAQLTALLVAVGVAVPVLFGWARRKTWPAATPQLRRRPESRTVAEADPLRLGVHRAPDLADLDRAQPRTSVGWSVDEPLPEYLMRPHDRALRALLRHVADPAEDRSLLVVLTGDSSVGKTRALWEAVHALAPEWRLLTPVDAVELNGLLEAGEPTPCTVLWLNEMQRHLDGDAGRTAAEHLKGVLDTVPQVMAVGAMWTPYWHHFTAQGGTPDADASARELLTGADARRIQVPDQLDRDQRKEMAELAKRKRHTAVGGDQRLISALEAGADDGRVIQHLTGGPQLMDAYRHGGLFTPVEHALITAALDARRLGYLAPVPAAMLTVAADGYLSPWERPSDPAVFTTALEDLTRGHRADGSRTDIRRTLTALTPRRERAGDPAAFEPHDYLQQHASLERCYQIPPDSFWAGAAHQPGSGYLAYAARAHGLVRHAAQLHKQAAAHGDAVAAIDLLLQMYALHPTDTRPAMWAAAQTALNDIFWLSEAIGVLHRSGGAQQATALTEYAADHIDVTDPDVAKMLKTMHTVGASQAINRLLARNPAGRMHLDSQEAITSLLSALVQVGAEQQVTVLADRATEIDIDLLFATKGLPGRSPLLNALHKAGAQQQVDHLADHIVEWVDAQSVSPELLDLLRDVGAETQAATLAARFPRESTPGEPLSTEMLALLTQAIGQEKRGESEDSDDESISATDPDDPEVLVKTLTDLHIQSLIGGDPQRLGTFLASDPAARARLDDPGKVAELLFKLREVEANDQASVLADRAAAHTDLRNPSLTFIAHERASGAIRLLEAMVAADLDQPARILTERLPTAGLFGLYLRRNNHADLYRFGRDPEDGTPVSPWGWDDLD